MRAKCAVTFEFDRRAPVTWRGEVSAFGVQTLVSRAVKQAKRDLHPARWSSMNVVVLERLDEEEEQDEAEEPSGAGTPSDAEG